MAAISPFRERSAQALSLAHEIVNNFWGRGLWRSGGEGGRQRMAPVGFLGWASVLQGGHEAIEQRD